MLDSFNCEKKHEMIVASVVEAVIVFFLASGNGSKNELGLNLQKLLLSVTIYTQP